MQLKILVVVCIAFAFAAVVTLTKQHTESTEVSASAWSVTCSHNLILISSLHLFNLRL